MSDDIVKWLRFHIWTDEPTALDRAADEIERLRAELAAERELKEKYMRKAIARTKERNKLREALEPFANHREQHVCQYGGLSDEHMMAPAVTVGDLRRARNVLDETK
jgi:hypothetical protein